MLTVLLVSICLGSAAATPAGSYLARMVEALELYRRDLPATQPIADLAAQKLATGGKLWASGNPALVNEFCSRAGGIMMIRPLANNTSAPGDVVLHFSESGSSPDSTPAPNKALVISFADSSQSADPVAFCTHAKQAGISPTLAMAACGWVFTGELIGALTRLGKMPVIYESIGGYGGYGRIQEYENGDISFHDKMIVHSVAPGVLGGRYIDAVSAILRRIEKEERKNIDRAGAWAHDANKRLMYSMGHVFPDEISKTDIGKLFHSGTWDAGFRNLPKADDTLSPGDLMIHIGYQHPPSELLRRARTAGARSVYVSVRPDRDFISGKDVIWIDPMWDWLDACVTLENYDIPILPASGVVNGSIAWEIYRLAKK